jgi:hypothetical protein
VVPADSDGISRVPPYSGTCPARPAVFAYGAFTLCGVRFHGLPLTVDFVTRRYHCSSTRTGPTTPNELGLQAVTSIRFGLIPFRSPLLRESRFLSFPQGTEMFHFPCLPSLPYVFRQGYARITTRGFPHSEISGSKVVRHLTGAYRSLPRPSSALIAKASTMRPY